MNVKEASQLITMINNEYSWASKGMTENDLKAKWKTWAADFKEIPYETVKAAWDYYRINDDLNRPPNVGALMKIIKNGQNQADGTPSAEDAWALVLKASRNGIRGSVDEYNKLPAEVQACIGSHLVIYNLAVSENPTDISVEKSRFVKAYEARRQQQMDVDILPGSTRDQLGYNKAQELTRIAEVTDHALPDAAVTAQIRAGTGGRPTKEQLQAIFGSMPGLKAAN